MSAHDSAMELLRESTGFGFDIAMRKRLARALQTGAAARGQSAEAYVADAAQSPGVLQDLIDRATVPETSFFRQPDQLEAFAAHVLPRLGEPLSVWCGGCSSGQEPYSIAMLLAESGLREWNVIASDIATPALRRTEEATYSERELRGLAGWRRDRWLQREGSRFTVVEPLRERVTGMRHNLVAEDPPFPSGSCELVLCRNTLIYFHTAAQERLLARLHRWLPPGGVLLVGASESLSHLCTDLVAVELGDAYAYAKTERAAARTPSPGPSRASRPSRVPRPSSPIRPLRAPHPRTSPPAPRASRGSAEPLPELGALVAAGDAAAARGEFDVAVKTYRQAAYVAPDSPLPHALLGLALEHADKAGAARRAFRAAWAALERSDEDQVAPGLEGYRTETLARMLADKLGASA